MCNETDNWQWRIEDGFSHVDAVDGSHLTRCRCIGGTYHYKNTCKECDPACETCNNYGPNQCETCADGYFLQYDYICKDTCPLDYV